MKSLFKRQRNAISLKDGFLHVDESQLDIFEHTDIQLPDWQPRKVKPLEECTYLCLDIETTGLGNSNQRDYINANFDPCGCVIKMIGLKSHEGKYKILAGNDEKAILSQFVNILMLKRPDFLFTFNGFNFDIPFIISRLNFYGIYSPFWVAPNPSTMASAQRFGKPAIFHQFHLSWGNGEKTHMIDLYLAALAWDFVARKLTEFSLKKIPVALGLRGESDRVELSFQQMLDCYEKGNWDLMSTYLRDDLDDTDRLQAFFMPSIYYQQLVIPGFNPQQLFIYGNATKLNKFLNTFYGEHNKPEIEPKVRFQGGKTRANCGFFRNVVKMDVASLYPTIMLAYAINSKKDSKNQMLGALSYLKKTRLWHKANAKDKSKPEAERRLSKQIEGAYKVIINSCFTGETEVLTSKGVFPIKELSGSSHEVLNLNGNWSNSEFKSFGVQKIWEIKLKKGHKEKVIRTTADHKWLAAPKSRLRKTVKVDGRKVLIRNENCEFDELTTENLKLGMIIPSSNFLDIDRNNDYYNGIIHGIIYGDGHKLPQNSKWAIDLANCKKELIFYLEQSDDVYNISYRKGNDVIFSRISFYTKSKSNYKKLPDVYNRSYLLGFFHGLLGTDGTVNKRDGSVKMYGDYDTVQWCINVLPILGIFHNRLHTKGFRNDEKEILGCISKLNKDSYQLDFDKWYFQKSDFIRDFHRANFINSVANKPYKTMNLWQVISVEETEQYEEVFCCIEPETHYFTLADNIITGNCYGFLGAIGDYNDYEAAALVTAYGRKILDHMVKTSLDMGATIANIDTDAVAISCPEGKADEICRVLKESVPEWVDLEREWDADVYVPSTISLDSFEKSYKLKSHNGVRLLCKIFQSETVIDIDTQEEIEIPAITEAEQALMLTKFGDRKVSLELFYEMSQILGRNFVTSEGLRKNYIVFLKDGSIKTMGKYRKRDKSKLFKQWPVDYLKVFRENGKDAADKFYLETVNLISSGNYPLEDLCITKKIPVSDKKFTRQGLGEHGDVITYYATSPDSEALLGSGKPYSVEVYLKDLESYYKEIQDTLTIQKILDGNKEARREIAEYTLLSA